MSNRFLTSLLMLYYLVNMAQPAGNSSLFSNTDSCRCEPLLHTYNGQFVPSITNFCAYKDLLKISKWNLSGGESAFNKLYMDKFVSSGGGSESFGYSFDLVSYPPIRFISPSQSFTMNVTPCKPGSKVFALPLGIGVQNALSNKVTNMNVENFDYSAQSYFYFLWEFYGLELNRLFEDQLNGMIEENIDLDFLALNKYITSLNARFLTRIALVNSKNYDPENTFQNILTALETKKVNLEELFLKDFVRVKGARHKVTESEKRRLQSIFVRYYNDLNIDRFEKDFMTTHYILVLSETKYLGIEFDHHLLRAWNLKTNKPVITDSTSAYINASVLMNISNLSYESEDDLWKLQVHSACVLPTEISNTGILVDFKNCMVITDRQLPRQVNFSTDNYELFIIDSTYVKPQSMMRGGKVPVYDTLITNFEGLFVEKAELSIPFPEDYILVEGKNLAMNSRFIAGKLLIPIIRNGSSTEFEIQGKKGNILTTDEKFLSHLKSIGLEISGAQPVNIHSPDQNILELSFRKMASK